MGRHLHSFAQEQVEGKHQSHGAGENEWVQQRPERPMLINRCLCKGNTYWMIGEGMLVVPTTAVCSGTGSAGVICCSSAIFWSNLVSSTDAEAGTTASAHVHHSQSRGGHANAADGPATYTTSAMDVVLSSIPPFPL